MNLEIFGDKSTHKNKFRFQILCLDSNSDVEIEQFWLIFRSQFEQKNTEINFSSESLKTKEHKEGNSCEKYDFSLNAFYKIWPILKKLSQNVDFLHLPLLEIFAVN